MKKVTYLVMSLAVIALVAVPGSASASGTLHHEYVTETAYLSFTGTNVRFSGEAGGLECHLNSEATYPVGTTGSITSMEPAGKASEACKATGGINHCTVTAVAADGFPWTTHSNGAGTVEVTTGTVTTDLTGFLCPDTAITPGKIHYTTTELTTTSTVTISGTLMADSPGGAVSLSGTVHVLGPITYGQ